MQGQGFKRKICDYYHDEGVIDGEPALKKAAIYSDEACRKIWRIGSAMNTRKARKQALVHIGNTRYSAMSKVLRDLRPVSETEVKQDNRRVSVNAECVMAQYPTSRSAHTYSPSSEDDELNLLWYAKQDPMKITKQSVSTNIPFHLPAKIYRLTTCCRRKRNFPDSGRISSNAACCFEFVMPVFASHRNTGRWKSLTSCRGFVLRTCMVRTKNITA